MPRAAVLALAFAVLAAGTGAALPVLLPPQPDQLVEGHTVFTVVQRMSDATGSGGNGSRFGAAVAVLVREWTTSGQDFPLARGLGVLWFNDQYLVNPFDPVRPPGIERYPCSGAVLAVNAGDPLTFDATNGSYTIGDAEYVESYLITDPNDHSWNVDRWRSSQGHAVWSVALLDNATGYSVPDDGECNSSAFADGGCTGLSVPRLGCQSVGPPMGIQTGFAEHAADPGANGYRYPCGELSEPCERIRYNAVLYFRVEDLRLPGVPKNHTETSGNWSSDVSGCDASTSEWPCPGGDDHREGNSHPFNPMAPPPLATYDGADNHGGSADCTADGAGDADCHATFHVDVYYGYAKTPLIRKYEVYDTVGRSAPYHCHTNADACNAFG